MLRRALRINGGPGARRATAALEFAIVAPVFMLFLGILFDAGILLFQQAMLDNATARAVRLIRTGSIQLAGGAVTPFTTSLCDDIGLLIPCTSLQYKVTSAASFTSLSTTVASNGHGTLTGNGTFTPGTAGQDVVVQVAWNRPYLVPWVARAVAPGGSLMMTSITAFRNELYK